MGVSLAVDADGLPRGLRRRLRVLPVRAHLVEPRGRRLDRARVAGLAPLGRPAAAAVPPARRAAADAGAALLADGAVRWNRKRRCEIQRE